MIVRFETTSQTIAEAIHAVHHGSDKPVQYITTDSRLVDDNSLFVPIVGHKFDGHEFIDDVCKTGRCSAYLTHRADIVEKATQYNVSAIYCNDTLQAYAAIARWHRKKFNIPVIGITGTNGKTTTKEMIAHVLAAHGNCLKTQKNYNNEIGVPFTILHLDTTHMHAVIEMGMNHSGEISRLSHIAMPTIAVITNIGEGHLEFLGSTENVAHAKSEIMDGMSQGSICILNNDTKHTDIVKKKARDKNIKIVTYGLTGDVCPSSYSLFCDRTTVEYDGIEITVPAYGLHNVYAAIATIAVARVMGIPLDSVKEALHSFKPVTMRSDIKKGRCIIIDDCYNANPLSMEYAFKSAAMVFSDKRKIAVLSDMKELGSLSKDLHFSVGTKLHDHGFERLFVYGSDAQYIAQGAIAGGLKTSQVSVFNTKEELIAFLLTFVKEDDVVLVKGSRSMKMEEVVNALEQ
ncbi:MAG: UDP-N-acetylmuramoyl-tripeptide--D-alanyl-D-alanine ligase [Spirochaetes bacterium]|nr:UDP-N-acetylmuramoyl-tripeptide--D-alanyl-D-alanine ligase [Spirochaetota bacterium]